tara:strand:+ start:240 stop:383 length:144 start_codon:yes stop_codon:yes gene_type:complete
MFIFFFIFAIPSAVKPTFDFKFFKFTNSDGESGMFPARNILPINKIK